ncbi:STAS domain-containing protein [Leptospira sp. 201903071]|uniref:STAS domain-containing protein n=1 Tax=Leptospira ainazelensis TaxID=2810034 RepID=UPI0019653559|nr:STAS domain-containing protein [Leptospira ainazelensis]MBM9498935.1 STAS domain-containing protein [Leptospira ainazelensis]
MAFEIKKESVTFRSDNAQVSGLKIWIEGELTIYDALILKETFDTILRNSNSILEIDLSRVSKLDTSCLQILLALKKEARKKEFTIRFINHSHAVLKLIDLYGLTGFLRDKIKLQKEDLKEFSFQYGMGKD